MLPISQNTLKTLAEKNEEGDKLMEIRDGDVAIFTGYVALSISQFSPMQNGLRDFEGTEKAGQVIFPWLPDVINLDEVSEHFLEIPLMTIHYLHKVVKSWFKARRKGADMPYILLDIEQDGLNARISVSGSGEDKDLRLNLATEVAIEDLDAFGNVRLAFTAKEFVDFLELFARLKAEDKSACLLYGKDKTYLSTFVNNHSIVAATPFNDESVKVERKVAVEEVGPAG